MEIKPYSRNEIAQRSRRRQKIKEEEAEKLGVSRKKVWLKDEQKQAVESLGVDLDVAISKGLSEFLANKGVSVDSNLPIEEIEENTMIRQKRAGL